MVPDKSPINAVKPTTSDAAVKFIAPTADEMSGLRQTVALYKSNLFKLQIEELVKEIHSVVPASIDAILHKLKDIFDGMAEVQESSLSDIMALFERESIIIPFAHPPCASTQIKFAFYKPAQVAIVGSFLLKSFVKSRNGYNIDIALDMPAKLFTEKDYLNHRYFQKRSVYLAFIVRELKKHIQPLGLVMHFELLNGDERRPVICLTASEATAELKNQKIKLRIIPSLSESALPLHKLGPGRNCVRPTSSTDTPIPTPRYNTSLLMDTAYVSHLSYIHVQSEACPAYRETCMLAKIWLHQRAQVLQSSGMNGFVLEMVMAWLLTCGAPNGKPLLLKTYSSFQLFKLTLEFLARFDFNASPLFLTKGGKAIESIEFSADTFSSNSQVCIIDPSGRINLTGHMSKSQLLYFQQLIVQSVGYLDDPSDDRFEPLFLQKIDCLHLEYDHVIRAKVDYLNPPALKSSEALDYVSNAEYVVVNIPAKIEAGLGNRAKAITAQLVHYNNSWSINAIPNHDDSLIFIGIKLDPEFCLSGVVYGPSPESQNSDKEISDFKKLWGSKSELRRFKDGSIVESVVFENDGTFEERSLVSLEMASYLFQRHAGLTSKSSVVAWGSQLFIFLKAPSANEIPIVNKSFKPVLDVFDELCKKLRDINELPLSIAKISPLSPALRYTSTLIPQPIRTSEYIHYTTPMQVLIEFESSARWPDNFEAVQEMKVAFYIQIAKCLPNEWPGTSTLIMDDETVSINQTINAYGRNILENRFIEITSPLGYKFQCRIHNDRESQLVDAKLSPSYNHAFVIIPQYAARIQSLALELPSLPYTIRIFKRWLSSHLLLDSHIPEMIAELICVAAYTCKREPWTAPSCSPMTGFMRVLSLIQSFSWLDAPLILFPDDSAAASIEEGFTNIRRCIDLDGGFGGGYMFIASDIDQSCSVWEKRRGNSKQTGDWLVKLAKSSLKHLEKCILSGSSSDIASIFVSPDSFDNMLQLDPKLCTRFYESLQFNPEVAPKRKLGFKNLKSKIDIDPLEYLSSISTVEKYVEVLKASFSRFADFYYDIHGGCIIGIKWKTHVSVDENQVIATHPSKKRKSGKKGASKRMIVNNKEQLYTQMQELGHGLVLLE